MLKKLKNKFIIINMTCVSVILLLVFIAICIASYKTERTDIIRQLDIASSRVDPHGGMPPSNQNPNKNGIFPENEISISTITVILDSQGDITKTFTNSEESEAKPLLKEVVAVILSDDNTEGILWNYSLVFSVQRTPFETCISFTSLTTLTQRLKTVTSICGIVLLCCLALFLLLSHILSSVAIKPAERTWEGQKQFIADASHDLKTPLTVILANTEIIKSHKGESVESVTKWLSSTKEESERMKRLVDSMLELASTENLRESITLCETDISELCERTVLQMEPVAFEKNVTIDSRIEKNLIAKAHADSFTRLVHILIDNGIKYSKNGSTLSVIMIKDRKEAKLSVLNVGSYISNEELPHLFERFYRGDKARSSDGGFGLGLSIAKNLTETMGGEIAAQSREGIGTEFIVKLPLSKQ